MVSRRRNAHSSSYGCSSATGSKMFRRRNTVRRRMFVRCNVESSSKDQIVLMVSRRDTARTSLSCRDTGTTSLPCCYEQTNTTSFSSLSRNHHGAYCSMLLMPATVAWWLTRSPSKLKVVGSSLPTVFVFFNKLSLV